MSTQALKIILICPVCRVRYLWYALIIYLYEVSQMQSIQTTLNPETGKAASSNQYFTPGLLIRFMWSLILKMGLRDCIALEPSAGSGSFLKHAPPTFNIHATEIDPDAYELLNAEHGSNHVCHNLSFEKFSQAALLNCLSYRLVIGNVPFGIRGSIADDKQYQNFTKHEQYFIARSLDLLDQNGICALIVPSSVMTSKDNEFRSYIDSRADLIAAYRFSIDAFKASGAQVLTDLIILKAGSTKQDQAFIDGLYYQSNQNNIFGSPGLDRWGKESVIGAINPNDLRNAIQSFTYKALKPIAKIMPVVEVIKKSDPALEAAIIAGDLINSLLSDDSKRSEAIEAIKAFKAKYDIKAIKKHAKKHSQVSALIAAWDLDYIAPSVVKKEVALSADHLIKTSLDYTLDPADLPAEFHHELQNYFKIPGSHLYTTLDHYLSGDLYSKIDLLTDLGGYDDVIDMLASKLKHTPLDQAHISLRDNWISLEIKNEFLSFLDNEINCNQWSVYGKINFESGFYTVSGNDGSNTTYQSHDAQLLEKYLNHLGLGGKDQTKDQRIQEMKDLESTFRDWILASEYVSDLETSYNRAFNRFVQPEYSQDAIDIPKFNFKLHGYQNQALRKMLGMGSGIMALDVGLGKTLTSIALAAKLKADGKANKPMIVVPKSVMSNWKREIDRSTSGLKVLYIGENFKTDGKSTTMSKAQREIALKSCVLDTWDLVVISNSAFEQIPLSPESSEIYSDQEFYNDQYGSKLTEYKANKEADKHACKTELRKFLNVSEQTFFDDLGIDCLIYDEAHALKNFKGSKQQSRINYLPSGDGAKRSFDFNAKSSYLRSLNSSHVFLLTATPTKNNPLEIYAMISHIAPSEWLDRGIHNVDQFIDHYGQIEPRLILSPSGDYYEASCLVGFNNLSQLREILFKYTDMRNALEVGLPLPVPSQVIEVSDMDQAQSDLYEELRLRCATMKQKDGTEDHLFRIMHDMECASFAPQLKYFEFDQDYVSPKLKQLCENVLKHIDSGNQIIFTSDLFVRSHDIIKRALVASGIDEALIGIGNGVTCPKSSDRQKLSDRFNSGVIKILIGNDGVIGQGMNLQENTSCIHHATLPWTPADIQQRDGRGVRQGNTQSNVMIFCYFGKGTFDSIRHQALMRKADWIGDLWRGNSESYINENASSKGGLDPADLQIVLSPDPEQARINLESVKHNAMQAYNMKRKVNSYHEYTRLLNMQEKIRKLNKNNPDSVILQSMQSSFNAAIQALYESDVFSHKELLPNDSINWLQRKDVYIVSQTNSVLVEGDYVTGLLEMSTDKENYALTEVYFKLESISRYAKQINLKLICSKEMERNQRTWFYLDFDKLALKSVNSVSSESFNYDEVAAYQSNFKGMK